MISSQKSTYIDQNNYRMKMSGFTQFKPLKEKTSYNDYNDFCSLYLVTKCDETARKSMFNLLIHCNKIP